MSNQKKGATPSQGTRAKAPANRKPKPSVAELQPRRGEPTLFTTLIVGLVGGVILFALAFVVACY